MDTRVTVRHTLGSLALHALVFRSVATARFAGLAASNLKRVADQYQNAHDVLYKPEEHPDNYEAALDFEVTPYADVATLEELQRKVEWTEMDKSPTVWKAEFYNLSDRHKEPKMAQGFPIVKYSYYEFVEALKRAYVMVDGVEVFAQYGQIGDVMTIRRRFDENNVRELVISIERR